MKKRPIIIRVNDNFGDSIIITLYADFHKEALSVLLACVKDLCAEYLED